MSSDKIRLFVCNSCDEVYPIPWYPMDAPRENDDTLNLRYAEHHPPQHHVAWGEAIESEWDNPQLRLALLKKLKEEVGGGNFGSGEGLGSKFYEVKSTFQEDAMKCWKQHNRTTDCGDWRSYKKRLLPDTKTARKELGLAKKSPVHTFLCDFCPMTSIKMQRMRSDRGDYDFRG